MSVSVGDKVQIKAGGIDVTNGAKAKAGKLYGEGGTLFGEVKQIIENWNTDGKYGLPKTVTKVRIADNKGNIVWQVRPEDIAENKITEEPPAQPPPEPAPVPELEPEPEQLWKEAESKEVRSPASVNPTNSAYAPQYGSNNWDTGTSSTGESKYTNLANKIKDFASRRTLAEMDTTDGPKLTSQITTKPASVGVPGIEEIETTRTVFSNMASDDKSRAELLNNNPTLIQNTSGYPYKLSDPDNLYPAQYDYKFIPGDNRYSSSSTLEDDLMKFRMSTGIQVHGSSELAKSVKMYMYNRYKSPDTNMAQSKMYTHVFFTRPDLYLMDSATTAAPQALNHTDTAMTWRRYPELFKLLTDRARCNDDNNFNMLLSNQIQSFSLHDEKISTKDAGHSWTKQIMTYGDSYTGRGADTFDCTFMETNELSVINLIKLWMTYIDNVHTGAWSPNYKSGQCHVHDRALDYAASVYVIKCGVDGEEILYWSKYYGVFPITTGATVLSWDSSETNKVLTPTIEFAYSFKKDLSPVTLLEFNDAAAIVGPQTYVQSYDAEINGTSRPYVGTPYIEIDLGEPNLKPNDISTGKKTQIRLKFKKDTNISRSDTNLFRSQ